MHTKNKNTVLQHVSFCKCERRPTQVQITSVDNELIILRQCEQAVRSLIFRVQAILTSQFIDSIPLHIAVAG